MAISNSSNDSCNPLVDDSELKNGGIPYILAVNVGIGTILFCCFLVLHWCCRDFAMAGVMHKKRNYLLSEEEGGIDEEDSIRQRRRGSSVSVTKDVCESVMKFVTMGEGGVRRRIGALGSAYLTLQLYLLALLAVYTLLSLVVILPVNISGKQQSNVPFASTTLANVSPESPLLWIHVVFSVVYFVFAGVFLIHFVLKHDDSQTLAQSVMITRIPQYVHTEDLLQHLEEACPNSRVTDIKFAYDTRTLHKKWNKLKRALYELEVAKAHATECGHTLMVRDGYCSGRTVPAMEHYTEQIDLLKSGIALERNNALNSKLPISFVSFGKEESATELVDTYRLCRCGPVSSLSDSIQSKYWGVEIASSPGDILWDNLSLSGILWWCKCALINTALIVFLIFFTTPAVLLNSVPQLKQLHFGNSTLVLTPDYLRSYWSSFLLIVFGILLLFLVTKSVYLEHYWSRTQRELVILKKAFIFKVLQVIVLPSIGLTSLSALANYFHPKDLTNRLNCVFLPNNGAFFISYIVIATFVSTPIELLRIPQLLLYLYGRITVKTKHERRQVMKKILRTNFNLGIQYAYSLLLFTLTVTFSLSVPIIAPFGLLFCIVKYFVDKYNLLYAYRPLPVDNNVYIHKTAVKTAIIGVFLLQLQTLVYSIVRTGAFTALSITSLVFVLLSVLIMTGVFIYGWFSYLLPSLRRLIGYKPLLNGLSEEDLEPGSYIAPVLSESADQINSESASLAANTYESFGRTIAGGEVKISPTVHHS